jgi:hypothetical protein
MIGQKTTFWMRIVNLLFGIGYAIFYDYIFKVYIHEVWGYMNGADYVSMSSDDFIEYVLISATPFLLYTGIKTVASSFSLFLYILVYVPFINNLYVHTYPDNLSTSYLYVFFIFMCLFFYTDKFSLFKSFLTKKRRLLPIKGFERITLFLFLVVTVSNLGSLRFVNFYVDNDLMYDLRENTSINFVYTYCWLRTALLPILMVLYLRRGDKKKFFLVSFCFVILFMLDKAKSTLLYPLIFYGLYLIFVFQKENFSRKFHYVLMLIIVIVSLLLNNYRENPIAAVTAGVFILRTVCMEGMELWTYLNFFEVHHNPFTYFSHVNIINFFTGMYPYERAIGWAVTEGGGNANGTFWLMDGVASSGIIGVVIISILYVIFKSAFNALSVKCDPIILVMITLNSILSMINVSLFTALNTCGFIIIYLILMFFDTSELVQNKEQGQFKAIIKKRLFKNINS